MKEGWSYKRIKEVGEVIGGTTPSTNNPDFWGGNLCWISPAELHGEHYLYDSVKKITQKAVDAKSLKELPIGSVILSSRAPIGKLAINKVPMYCNQGFKCVVCGSELYNEYLYWWLYGKKDYLNSLGTGATFPEISKTVVENIVIPVAPIEEQRSIVTRLDAAFSHIDALKANAEKQLNEARKLFQAELTECMKPKEGWEEKRIGDVFQTYAGGTPLKSGKGYYEGGTIPWIRSGEVCQMYIRECEMYITEEGLKNSSAKYYPIDTVLVAMYGATAAQVGILKFEATSNQAVCGILPHKDFMPEYIYYWFTNIQEDLAAQAQGGAQPNLSQVKIKKVTISYPSLAEQRSIASHLDSLSSNIRKLEELQQKTIAECDALKQAMLREVFE